jgi:hypothetical protein
LDPNGKISEEVSIDSEFQKKGYKAWEYPLQKIKEETVKIRRGVPTHWPTVRGLCALFKNGGFTEVRIMGDGLLMQPLLDREETIIEMMKRNPQIFFQIEKRLIPYVNPNRASSMILRATAP